MVEHRNPGINKHTEAAAMMAESIKTLLHRSARRRRSTKNDRIYAPLPLCKRNCGCNTVIAEDSGVEINGDNLWRWNQHTFGEMPMYKDLPDDLSKLSLADVMRHLQ